MEPQEAVQEPQEPQEQAPQVPPETVEHARSMGWIPKEEFRGDPGKWRPADEYVKRAETLMPILKSQLGRYEEKIGKYESEITNLKTAIEGQKKTTEQLVKMSTTVQQQAYDRAKRDITLEQAKAVSEGDVTKWQELEDKKEKLPRPEPVVFEPAAAPPPDAFRVWHSQPGNDWYAKDETMTIFADAYATTLKQRNPALAYEQVLAQVDAKVKESFPHKFTNPNRQAAAAVDGGGQRTVTGAPGGRKSYNDLPAEAKAQCDIFVKDGLLTKEKYIKDYFELEA